MIDILSDNTLITMFVVIALGTAFGAIKFGPIQFGAAGALFVGLAVGAFIAPPNAELGLLQSLGLGLFVYLLGLEAGEAFFRNIRSQFWLMAVNAVAVLLAAVTAVGAGALLGVSREMAVGTFAGAMTSTPSLSLVQEQTGSDLPAVGYSIGYPTGIVVAIILVLFTVNRTWKAGRDQAGDSDAQLRGIFVRVDRPVSSTELREKLDGRFVVGTVSRGRRYEVVGNTYDLQPGDIIYVMIDRADQDEFVDLVGERLPSQGLRNPRLTVQRYTLSNQDLAGNTVGNLPLFRNHGAQILRVRRGDERVLATEDTHLASGDIVEVVHPTARQQSVENFFGNSVQTASSLDWVATALGLAAGFALAIVPIPLPGGASFALGAAGGPLIIGLILGALHRTGRFAWQLPMSANFSVRQLGLMLFLAAVGVASGPAFASTAFSLDGLITIVLAAIIALVGCGSVLIGGYFLGQSAQRSNGAVSGQLGQPAVLQYALQNSSDSRIMAGYSATFAIALILKILVVPFMLV